MFLVNRAETDLVHLLACLRQAQSILEIGTAHGYWTLWLALAAGRCGGRVTTIEIKPERRQKAMEARAAAIAQARERGDALVQQARATLEADVAAAKGVLQSESSRLADQVIHTVLKPAAAAGGRHG